MQRFISRISGSEDGNCPEVMWQIPHAGDTIAPLTALEGGDSYDYFKDNKICEKERHQLQNLMPVWERIYLKKRK